MPTLTIPLAGRPAVPAPRHVLRPLGDVGVDGLAALYLASYPPGVAVADLLEARAEMAATLAGEYGVLRPGASAAVLIDGHATGAVMVVERSIWDEDPAGPFVIDLFVSPEARGRGAGRALMTHAIGVCAASGDPALSLRVGDGTSAAAHRLYRDLGFLRV